MRRDFEEYLVQVQKQRNNMNKALEELKEKALKGEVDPDTVNLISKNVTILETNYKRLLYCRHLLNLPPKFIQKIRVKKLLKKQEEFKKAQADSESVSQENREAINTIEDINESFANSPEAEGAAK